MRSIAIDQAGAALYKQDSGNANELNYDAKQSAPLDPVAFRFGAWAPGYFAKICGDFLTGSEADPSRSERIFIALRTDDHPQAAPLSGCLEVYIQHDPVGHETDAGEKLVARLTARAGLELFVPLNAYAGIPRGLPPNASGPTDTMWAPDGLSFTQQQSDSNFVTYTTSVPFDKGPAVAVWSAWTGRLGA